ncbi:hypothetical protein V1477_020352 [Vespula maculifrons]|uniref:Uncharacterized protein n=1 Tax=Vespula maculifrons TaxID=7453 RepID=A0ABD2ALN9_VESMC
MRRLFRSKLTNLLSVDERDHIVKFGNMCVYNGLDGVNLGSCKYHCKSEFDVLRIGAETSGIYVENVSESMSDLPHFDFFFYSCFASFITNFLKQLSETNNKSTLAPLHSCKYYRKYNYYFNTLLTGIQQ